MRRPTIHDVAQRAGVSVTTVSMVLRRQAGYKYRPATEDKVRQAARDLGYQPHTAARMLRQQQTSLVGIGIAGGRLGLEIAELVQDVHNELVSRGYQPLVVDTGVLRSDPGRPWFPGPEVLAGLISMDLTLEEHSLDAYTVGWRRLPLVSINPLRDRSIDCVTTDRARALEMAVEHLHGLGHRRIAFVGLEEDHPANREKLVGYQRAVKRMKLDRDPALTILISRDAVFTLTDRPGSYTERLLALSPRATAVVCSSDNDALQIMRNLLVQGTDIPGDMSITGFGGVVYSTYCHPQLTTVAQDRKQIARAAVERILSQIGEPEAESAEDVVKPGRLLIEPILRIRGSTGPAPSS